MTDDAVLRFDGAAAMKACTTVADYKKVCALDRGESITALTDRFGLPHHPNPEGAPGNVDRAGVNAAWAALNGGRTGKPMTGAGIPAARAHLDAHRRALGIGQASSRPPRDMLVRAIAPAEYGVRAADPDDPDSPPIMFGHFNRFGEWAEIDSMFEGHFMERHMPGAFKKTFQERANRLRPLFNHGQDNQLGNQILGTVIDLREDAVGAYYEVELFRSVPPLILDGLKAGQYGSSFRFRVLREQFDREPGESDHNPEGLPERSVLEAEVFEFGPVTFPAYEGATAGVRSLTDEIFFSDLTHDPLHLRKIIDFSRDLATAGHDEAPSGDGEDPAPEDPPGPAPTGPSRRDDREPLFGEERGDHPEWML